MHYPYTAADLAFAFGVGVVVSAILTLLVRSAVWVVSAVAEGKKVADER